MYQFNAFNIQYLTIFKQYMFTSELSQIQLKHILMQIYSMQPYIIYNIEKEFGKP